MEDRSTGRVSTFPSLLHLASRSCLRAELTFANTSYRVRSYSPPLRTPQVLVSQLPQETTLRDRVTIFLFHLTLRVPSPMAILVHFPLNGYVGQPQRSATCFQKDLAHLIQTPQRQRPIRVIHQPPPLAVSYFTSVRKFAQAETALVCLANIDGVHLAYPMPTLPGNLFSLSPLLRAYCPRQKSDLSRISSGHIRTSVHSFGIDSAAVTLRYLGLFVMSAVTQSSLIPASSRPTCVVSICQASRRRLLVMCSPHGMAMAGTDQPTC